jgi:hypothetical protein
LLQNEDVDGGGGDDDGSNSTDHQALFGAFSDWSFLQGANQLLHHCSAMLGRIASAEQLLLKLVDAHKPVYFGATRLAPLLDNNSGSNNNSGSSSISTVSGTAGAGQQPQQQQQNDSQLIGLFLAQTQLSGDRALREALQVLWQRSHAVAPGGGTTTAAAAAAAGGAPSSPASAATRVTTTTTTTTTATTTPAPTTADTLLKESARAFCGLLSDARAFCFDLACLPVDECVAEIASKVMMAPPGGSTGGSDGNSNSSNSTAGSGGGDESSSNNADLSARYSVGVSAATRKLEEYTLNLVEQCASFHFGADSEANARATLDSVWASAERHWELLVRFCCACVGGPLRFRD